MCQVMDSELLVSFGLWQLLTKHREREFSGRKAPRSSTPVTISKLFPFLADAYIQKMYSEAHKWVSRPTLYSI